MTEELSSLLVGRGQGNKRGHQEQKGGVWGHGSS